MTWEFDNIRRVPGSNAFLATPPFYFTKRYAHEANCDLAVPNQGGIGNLLMFTRLVDDYARAQGRPIKLLTSPFRPNVGQHTRESDYPIWEGNPFVQEIVNADNFNAPIMEAVAAEIDNCCQFNHVIENILTHFQLRPSALRPSLYLTTEEMRSALRRLSNLPRPLVALHPGGTTSPPQKSPWHQDAWAAIVKELTGHVGFFQIAKSDFDKKCINVPHFDTTLREAFALIWAADAFIGFDSSPSHIAAAFQKPSLVLWDASQKISHEESVQYSFAPATTLRWGYPQNRNLMILGERDKEITNEIVQFCLSLPAQLYRQQPKFPFNSHCPSSP